MEKREQLIKKVNYITGLINEQKIKDKAVIELIKTIHEYDKFVLQLLEEVEADNINLCLERSNFDSIISNYRVRLNALGFSEFQFLTFSIPEAFSQRNNLKSFFSNHRQKIKSINGFRANKNTTQTGS